MNDSVSLRLDALRAVAALAVFCSHFAQLGLSAGNDDTLWALGRIGVVAFFVMSGYVIAYTAEHKHPTLRDYFEARLARLWSVFLPALALTAFLDFGGRILDPFLYQRYPQPADWRTIAYLPFLATFMFENSWFSLRWLSNGPMWSIAYEFWYYVLFGTLSYIPREKRLPLLACVLVLAGWKVLLLAPIWFSGVLLYRLRHQMVQLAPVWRAVLCCGALAGIGALLTDRMHALTLPLRLWGLHLGPAGFHSFFISDYLFAIPVIALAAALIAVPPAVSSQPVRRAVAWAAGFSFSLYLLHVPLILFLRSTGVYDAASLPQSVATAALVVFLCYLCATVTEHRKGFWRTLVGGLLSRSSLATAQRARRL